MEVYFILELLKWLFIVFELRNYLVHKKREKAVVALLEKYDQRLKSLEKKSKELP